MNQSIEIILKEMCKRVNADFSKLDFKSTDWFWQYTWSKEQEDDFRDWLIEFFKTNKQARKELLSTNSSKVKNLKKAADEFVWVYGWKVKEK